MKVSLVCFQWQEKRKFVGNKRVKAGVSLEEIPLQPYKVKENVGPLIVKLSDRCHNSSFESTPVFLTWCEMKVMETVRGNVQDQIMHRLKHQTTDTNSRKLSTANIKARHFMHTAVSCSQPIICRNIINHFGSC
jgi:hypothetical protein